MSPAAPHGAARPGHARPRRALAATLAAACTLALAVSAAPALAATPETPKAEHALAVTATNATLLGILNPGKEGEPGTYELGSYEFIYRPSAKNECKGAGETASPAGLSVGAGKEEIAQPVEGLTPHTSYAVCLIAHDETHTHTAASNPVTFTTATPPATPHTPPPRETTATTAQLNGTLNPNQPGDPGHYQYTIAPSATSCTAAEALVQPAEPGEPSTGEQAENAPLTATGLTPSTTYTACLLAHNEAAETAQGPTVTFTTLGAAPEITQQTVAAITAAATLHAAIDPENQPATYHAEYITETQLAEHGWGAATHAPAEDAGLPKAAGPQPVTDTITGLTPATTYSYRYTATNATGTTTSTPATFTTTAAGASTGLPDNRVYELVSTAGLYGEPYAPTAPEYGLATPTNKLFQVAADGERAAYIGEPAEAGGTGNTGGGEGNQWLATRTPAGWETHVVSPDGSGTETNYQAFNENLTTGILQSNVQPPLAPSAPVECQVLYTRPSTTGADTALLNETQTEHDCGHPLYAGQSTDATQTIFESEAALTTNAKPATEVPPGHGNGHIGGLGGSEGGEPCTYGCNLYDNHDGHLQLVNILPGPGAETVPNATFGGYPGNNPNKTDFSGAISSDGTRIYWTDTQEGLDMEHVYVLENNTTEIQVSGAGHAQYWTATPDGRYAYYTENGDLWRFDSHSNEREALTENAQLMGVTAINQIGADGEYLYYVAGNAELDSNARKGHAGQPNLYLRHETSPGHATTTLIATLAPRDNETFASAGASGEHVGDWAASLANRTAAATPDGQHLVFQSILPLTGYDNEDPYEGGHPVPEAYTYTAATAKLTCVSCNPTGTAPSIYQREGQTLLPISGETNNTSTGRWISNNGQRVFFQTVQPLLPQDNNGKQDVYEWEHEGEGTCTVQTPTRTGEACLFLISQADSEDLSFLIGIDTTGNNIFLTHRGPLGAAGVPASQNDLYDARVDGGFPQTQQGCTAGGCVNTPAPAPGTQAAPSTTLTGDGNYPPAAPTPKPKPKTAAQIRAEKLKHALKACRREHGRHRSHCEHAARKRYGAARARRTRTDRKANP